MPYQQLVIFTAKNSLDVFSLRREQVWTFSVLGDRSPDSNEGNIVKLMKYMYIAARIVHSDCVIRVSYQLSLFFSFASFSYFSRVRFSTIPVRYLRYKHQTI